MCEVVLHLMNSSLRSWPIMSSCADFFDALRRTKTIYLTTCSASGISGTVPIWFFEHRGRIYFCSRRDTLKVRRIRRSGHAVLRVGRRSGPATAGAESSEEVAPWRAGESPVAVLAPISTGF